MSKYIRPEDKLKIIYNDPKLFIQSFIKVQDKFGNYVPFRFNEVQDDLYKNLGSYNIVLKSRQLGVSTLVLALMIHKIVSKKGSHCMFFSHNLESTRLVFAKCRDLFFSIPEIIRPKVVKNNRNELELESGSKISVATLSASDKSRGASVTDGIVHISELAFVKDEYAKKQLLAIEQMVSNGIVICESTANGMGNFYHSMWQKAVNHESMYKPHFYNFLDSISMYQVDIQKAVKIYENLHGHKFDDDCLTDEERQLMRIDDRFTLDVICWRRMKIANSGEEFRQEYPYDDSEAFLTSGLSIFAPQPIQERIKNLPRPLNRKLLKGLPDELKPFINRSLFIYELPKDNVKYSLGCDVGEGIKCDFSSITILSEEGVEVCHFRSNTIAPHKFSEIVYLLGLYWKNPLMVIERASAGSVVLDRLRHTYKYKNLYKQKFYDDRGRKSKKRIGFSTTEKSRSILIFGYQEAFEEGEIVINTKATLSEMLTFVADKNGKIQHIQGSHDDSLFSAMLAVFGLKQPHYK